MPALTREPKPAARSARRRGTAALVTGALALGLSAVPATALAASAADTAHTVVTKPKPKPEPKTDVPVDGGLVKLQLSADLLKGLSAKGVVVAQLGSDCKIPAKVRPITALSVGVKAGDLRAEKDKKAGGKLALADTCVGLVNVKAKKGISLTNLRVDLEAGALLASVNGKAEVKLGSFDRPTLDKKTVDVKTNTLTIDADIQLNADIAAQLDALLDVKLFAGLKTLLDLDLDVSIAGDLDLGLDLGLDVGAKTSDWKGLLGLNILGVL